jgi:hypothetical protein
MKTLFRILILLFFSACGNEKPKGVTVKENKTDTLLKQEEEHQSKVKETAPKQFNIDSFLQKPFDLHEFKKKKGGANSGGTIAKPFYFTPNYKGFYYRFFLFGGSSKCDFGKRKTAKENGFIIITYKTFGEYCRDYLDPNEELIYLQAKCNYKELPQLAFVGFDTTYAVKKLGNYHFKRKNWQVYHFKKKALLLKVKGKIITELRYIYMNKPLQKEEDIDAIIKDKH